MIFDATSSTPPEAQPAIRHAASGKTADGTITYTRGFGNGRGQRRPGHDPLSRPGTYAVKLIVNNDRGYSTSIQK